MDDLLAWIHARSVPQAIGLSLLANILVFAGALVLGEIITRAWKTRRTADAPPDLTRTEIGLAAACVVLNSGVMFAGWWLFAHDYIHIASAPPWRWITDAIVLLLVMDLAMYVTHRMAHHPIAFRYVHGIHHVYDRPRPLTLFVLHPIEVIGFGGLWIAVLATHPFSLGGMIVYLALNTTFGVLGHTGVEPLRNSAFARILGTSTFHARHHDNENANYGFYTTIWDRLFRTMQARYDEKFPT